MNIFKILANGDGSINEANVSAFLGYLLDPKADHALGYEFLTAFLKSVTFEEGFKPKKYEYQLFYEQAFKEENLGKQIVDIVLVCYTINVGTGKESLVKKFIENRKVVHKIFLIENKIKSDSINSGQIERQFNSTVSELKDTSDAEIYSIYITPDNHKFIEEFDSTDLKESEKIHVFWKNDDNDKVVVKDDKTSIKSILSNIIKMESIGDIEPLNQYTLHTIKAFIQFIENGFKSEKEEAKTRINDGSYIKKFEELNASSNIEEKLNTLKAKLELINPNLKGKIIGPDLRSKRFPKLYLKDNDIRLGLVAGAKSREEINFGFSEDRNPKSKKKLDEICERLGLKLKKPYVKYGSYCRTEEMKENVKIEDVDLINIKILKFLSLILEP